MLKKLILVLVATVALTTISLVPVASAAPTPTNPVPKPICSDKYPNCGVDPATVPAAKCKDTYPPDSPAYTECVNQNDLFKKYLNPFIAFLSIVVGIAVVIGIIVGGIQYITSGGDPQAAANGKRHLRNAVIAFLMYLFLYALLNFLIPGGLIG